MEALSSWIIGNTTADRLISWSLEISISENFQNIMRCKLLLLEQMFQRNQQGTVTRGPCWMSFWDGFAARRKDSKIGIRYQVVDCFNGVGREIWYKETLPRQTPRDKGQNNIHRKKMTKQPVRHWDNEFGLHVRKRLLINLIAFLWITSNSGIVLDYLAIHSLQTDDSTICVRHGFELWQQEDSVRNRKRTLRAAPETGQFIIHRKATRWDRICGAK